MKLMDVQLTIKCLQINSACECSKPGPVDLGLVFCGGDLKLVSLNSHFFYPPKNATNDRPSNYNQLSIYKITFKRNGIRILHNLTFQRTGIYNLEIIQQKLIFLPNKCFFGLERTLRQLSLESNRLIALPSLALAGLRKLTYLNLNHNRIRKLSSDQLFPVTLHSTLRVLLIAHNHLAHIDAFTFNSLNALQYLDLSSNNLIFINDYAFCSASLISNSKLLYLNLAFNRLSLIPFTLLSSLTSLQVLDLANNLIESVQDNSNYLRANYKDAYRDGGYKVDHLDDAERREALSSTALSKSPNRPVNEICLDYLNLEHNQLTRLTNQSFGKFSCLRSLNLASNPIESIDDNAFKSVDINQLNLRDCKLTKLTSGVWTDKEHQLTHLDLSENMLSSDQQNDTFICLEKLTSFKFNDNVGKFQLNPLSLAQSQYSLMEFEFVQSINQPSVGRRPARNEQFNPIHYEIEFKNLRRLSLTFFGQWSSTGLQNRLDKKQLLAYGDSNLHYLDLSRSFIEDLTDRDLFESTPWLLHLNLSSNAIRKLNANIFKPLSNSLISLDLNSAFHPQLARTFDCEPLRHLSALRSLTLIENHINQFKHQSCFDQLTELRLLQLDFNQLTKLRPNQFEQLKSLVHLQLSNNNLEQIDANTFNELPKLVHIDLSFNCLRTVKTSAFNDLIALRHINLANNRLETLEQDAFINLPYLEHIALYKNQLKQFMWNAFDQIGALSKTLRIDLRSNKLEILNDAQSSSQPNGTAAKMTNYINSNNNNNNQLIMNFIEIIDLTSNELGEIDLNHFQIVRNSLIQIHLDHNRLRRLSKQSFANLPNLQYVSLSNNFLTTIPDDLLIEDYSLQEINFSFNLLISLPSRLFAHNYKLATIDLRNNLIKKLPNQLFANCSHLEQLYLDHNSLREFPLNALGSRHSNSIKVISLAFNYIEHLNALAIDIYRNLIHLNLSHNSIKQFDASAFAGLIELDVSFNKFQFDEIENSFSNYQSTRLHSLDLSGIGLRAMPMLNLANLISLNLGSNLLTFIYSHSFLHVEHLQRLNLSANRLTNVPNNLFNQRLGETLIELDLSYNPIYTLNNDSFVGLRKLRKLSIHGLHRLHYIQFGVFRPLQLLQDLSVSYYEHQITSLCSLFAIANLHIETLVIYFDSSACSTFKRKFLYDSTICTANLYELDSARTSSGSSYRSSYSGLGRKLDRIQFVGTSVKRLDRDVFSEFANDRLTLQFINTSIKHLALDLSNSIQTVDLHLDRSFQSNLELNTLNSRVGR